MDRRRIRAVDEGGGDVVVVVVVVTVVVAAVAGTVVAVGVVVVSPCLLSCFLPGGDDDALVKGDLTHSSGDGDGVWGEVEVEVEDVGGEEERGGPLPPP